MQNLHDLLLAQWSKINFNTTFLLYLNPFVPNAPFLYPLKTSGIEKGCIGNEWLKKVWKAHHKRYILADKTAKTLKY